MLGGGCKAADKPLTAAAQVLGDNGAVVDVTRAGHPRPQGDRREATRKAPMSLWHRSRKSPVRTNGVTAFLDEGSEIEGRYTFTGVALLNGKFKGEIVSSDTLIIGEKGVINATIRAGAVVISGEVVGGVLANERVEMKPSARVFGDVEAPVVIIEEGVLFEGHCRTKNRPPDAVAPAPDAGGGTGRDTPAPGRVAESMRAY